MFSIDGLASGLDTTAIIESLLSIQQSQVDRLDLRKQEVLVRQSAFKGIEANVLGLQSAAQQLGSFSNNVFDVFQATSSDENTLTVAAGGNAVPGIYQVSVSSLARAEQLGSQAFASADSEITQGTFSVQVGNRAALDIEVDSDNNSVQGLVDTINSGSSDVSAAIINDGQGYRVLLTSAHTGAANNITITNNTGPDSGNATQIDFSGGPVQTATDAVILLGSGPGAISISKSENVIDDVINGVTLNLESADPGTEITITVDRDIEPARDAIDSFVGAFNNLMDYITAQTAYDSESDQAGLLTGFNPANQIRDQVRNVLSRTVANLESSGNRLSTIGITFDDQGKLQTDSTKLDAALAGNVDGLDIESVRRIFATDAQSTSSGISLVSASSLTRPSDQPYQVVITQAAEQAVINATNALAPSITIDGSNDSFSLQVDNLTTDTLTLSQGIYTPEELAIELESTINAALDGKGEVGVTLGSNGELQILSNVYGSGSEVGQFSGTAAAALGFSGTETDQGINVAGYFLVDGQTESATGNGRILSGNPLNANTDGLQLRVTLGNNQINGSHQSDLTVTSGFAAQLNTVISGLLDPDSGKFKNTIDAFDDQVESIDQSVERLKSIFATKQQQLVDDFIAIEATINSLQTTSSFLSSQLASVGLTGIGQ